MKNVEREGSFIPQAETGDKEGTYEQKKGGDTGSQTVFRGTNSNANVFVQKKVKKKQTEKIVFTD